MVKTELICECCDKHYIVVDLEESPPNFCPFCSEPINGTTQLYDLDSE